MNNPHLTIKRLYPNAENVRDYILRQELDGSYSFENKTLPEGVTLEFLESEEEATTEALTQQAALKAGLLAAWGSTFTAGEQAFLKPLYDAAMEKMDAGDVAGVKELITTAPSISTSLDAKRATLAAIFPE